MILIEEYHQETEWLDKNLDFTKEVFEERRITGH
jgi:hypothetical protein